MKQFSILFCMIMLIACGKSDVNPDDNMIKIGESFTADDGTEISFLGLVEDSRCPSEAVCVWEGQAKVNIRVVPNATAHDIELTKRAGHPELAVTMVEDKTVRLVDVSPYPETTLLIDSSEYIITVEVE